MNKLVSRMRGNDNKIFCHSRESGNPAFCGAYT
jgi:hypothetical protein